MIDVLNLALPYFGLILAGFVCGKFKKLPDDGLAWMNFFLLYVSLPALFFRLLAKTPFEQLNNPPFVIATTAATAIAFALSAGLTYAFRRSGRDAAMGGLAGGYGNIGYMGPGLALATFGPQAAVPVALIFCFDNIFLFSVVPVLMAFAGVGRQSLPATLLHVAKQILLHPLIVASYLGAGAAALHLEPPVALDRMLEFLQNAAAPVALFALGVTVALRPFDRIPWDVPCVVMVKLLVHPILIFGCLALAGPFAPQWIAVALLMASLPPALNAFIIARQYNAWVEPASAAVLLGTFASIVTLTGAIYLLKTGQIPLH